MKPVYTAGMRRRNLLRAGLSAPLAGTALSGCVTPDAQRFQGAHRRMVLRDDPDYERWRQGMAWQTFKHDRYPDVIARPRTALEVADAVSYARRNRLPVVARSGGHNVSGAFFRDGGMLLDLGALQGVEVDARAGTAWVEPALWSRNLARVLQPQGFAFPYAHCGTVPMGGYLLGGGVGLNGDSWGGIACANILEAEVVLASGELVRVNAEQHPDLYWAVRGAGTGFPGVVTRYRLKLHTAPNVILSSAYVFPLPAAADAARWMERERRAAPQDTELMMLMAHTPQGPIAIARFVAFTADQVGAEQLLARYAQAPEAQKALVRMERVPTNFERWFSESVDASRGLGFGSYGVETIWTDRLAESIDAVASAFAEAPSTMSHILVSPRIHTATPNQAAFSMYGEAFVGVYSVWADDAHSANFAWLEQCAELLAPFAKGRYVNETDGFTARERVRSAFSEDAWARLAAVRAQEDRQGVFHGFPGWG